MHLLTKRGMTLLGAVLFTIFFYHQKPGINVLLFDALLLCYLFIPPGHRPRSASAWVVLSCFVLTTFGVVLSGSNLAVALNIILTALLPAVVLYTDVRSLHTLIPVSFYNATHAPFELMRNKSGKMNSLFTWIWKFRYLVIPGVVIVIFLGIYAAANKVFANLIESTANKVSELIERIFQNLDFSILFMFIVGFIISVVMVFRSVNNLWTEKDRNAGLKLYRRRSGKRRWFKNTIALKKEFVSAIFLLVALNLMLFVLNSIDISQMWFGYSWQGEDFAQIVHEGTGLLIFSILISIAIVLYFFRNNLNFYSKNKWLKILAYIWILQNGILVISVLIRNFHYCKIFSLADKRIGVFIFLLLVGFGLFTVFVKVKNKFTSFYLFRVNGIAVIAVLSITSLVPWDIVIAKYNFSRSGESFMFLEHMSQLSDKALPYLDHNREMLEQYTKTQYEQFQFRERNMTAEEYYQFIQMRKSGFVKRYEQQSFLSWNLAEYLAYVQLKVYSK